MLVNCTSPAFSNILLDCWHRTPDSCLEEQTGRGINYLALGALEVPAVPGLQDPPADDSFIIPSAFIVSFRLYIRRHKFDT